MRLYLKVSGKTAEYPLYDACDFISTQKYPPPSACLGLLYNIASEEMYKEDDKNRKKILDCKHSLNLSIGLNAFPIVNEQYFHDHRFLICENKDRVLYNYYGRHNSIKPRKKEFLTNINFNIALECSNIFGYKIINGLKGEIKRYGSLYLGKSGNNCCVSIVEKIPSCYWLKKINDYKILDECHNLSKLARLNLLINREDLHLTQSALFLPTDEKTEKIPPEAWVEYSF